MLEDAVLPLLQPVAAGHTDVGDEQVGAKLSHHLDRREAVFRLSRHLHAQGRPIHQGFDEAADQLFIVRNYNFPHKLPLFFLK